MFTRDAPIQAGRQTPAQFQRGTGTAAGTGTGRSRAGVTIGVLILLQLPLARLLPGTGFPRQLSAEGLFWLLTAFLLAYIVLIERRPLSSIGLRRPTWKSAAFGAGGACVLIAG